MVSTRDSILQIAIRQLGQGGYAELNFAPIADELNITRANIHHHFQNKENLAKEALQFYMQSRKNFVGSALKESSSFAEAVMSLEKFILSESEDPNQLGLCPCTSLMSGSESIPSILIELSERHFQNMLELFDSAISAAQKDGELSQKRSASELAKEFVLLSVGVMKMAPMNHHDPKLLKGSLEAWVKSLEE